MFEQTPSLLILAAGYLIGFWVGYLSACCLAKYSKALNFLPPELRRRLKDER